MAKVADPAWPRRGRVSYTERHGDGQETGGAPGVADVGGHGGPSDERWASLLRAAEPGPGGFRIRCVRRGVVRGLLRGPAGTAESASGSVFPDAVHRLFRGSDAPICQECEGEHYGEVCSRGTEGPRFARIAFTTHGQPRPSTRCAGPPLRSGPSGDCRGCDRAGSPCGPAGRLALDPLPGSATPASHSVVAENRRQTPEWDRVHLPDRGFAVARTIRKHAVGILAYLDTRMTERVRGRTHPARPTG